jgi:predicted phage terminase large subunit-like protein
MAKTNNRQSSRVSVRADLSTTSRRTPTLTIEYLPTDQLHPNPQNPRFHSDKQIEQIANSIRAFGFNMPIAINAENQVVGGNGRLEAARRLGHLNVPTIKLDHLTLEQQIAFAIADNRLTENSKWNQTLLAEQIKFLSELDLSFSLETTGFEVGEIDVMIANLTTADEEASDAVLPSAINGIPVSKAGDLWLLDRHRVLCDNSLVDANFRVLMQNHQAAMAFVDPPFICASYGQDLANKHSLDCRTLMTSLWYQRLFLARLAPQKQTLQEFLTTENGFRLATSVGGVLTGRGADFIIIDDPLKPDEALSETQRKAVNDWFDHTLYSRLNDKRTGCIIIIMQRLHQDDLVGRVLEQEHWDQVRLPAIAEDNETHIIESRYQTREFHRAAGEALHPEREPVALLKHLRQTLGEYNFAGQYQQQPAPLGGGMVKAQWFRSYVPGEEPSKFDLIFQSWDTANKSTELSDFSVCTTWGAKNKKLYLLNVFRKRLDYPNLKRAVREQAQLFKPQNILIEDKASGTQLIQEMIQECVYGATRYEPTMDKIMRLHSVTSTIENGFVYLPTEADWRVAYLHELTTFPNGKHDDQADSTSQALDWVKGRTFKLPLARYFVRMALRNGWPVEQWMLADANAEEAENGPLVCPQCNEACFAQYGFDCHCRQCGHMWKRPNRFSNEGVPTCTLEDGRVVEWDERLGLWIDPESLETFPLGE